jgi:hypothetical protein
MEASRLTRLTLAAAGLFLVAAPAGAISTYFTTQCAPCHSPAVVGSTATTCNGCHAHGTHPTSAKSSINIAGVTNLTSYAPGQQVSVTITGGYRTGWVRAVLFDQNMNQLAISTGPNGMGGGPGFPITLSAPAPSATGSYTWNVAWYGNRYDASTGVYGARWMDDPNNPDHGFEVVATNAFAVVAPTAPVIALVPASLDFGTVTMGSSASLPTQVRNSGTGDLTVTGISLCTSPITEPEYTWVAPTLPFTVPPGGATTVTVSYTPADPDTDTGCIAFASNGSNAPTINLAVNGTGVAPPTPVADVSPLSLDFGAVTDGSSAPRTFTVGNVGTAALTVTVAVATGTSAEFSAAPVSFSVAPGSSTVVTATYAPVDVGADAGSLLVQTNDPLQPSIPVALSGSGVAAPTPRLALSPASLDLGGVTVGASASQPTQVTNGGTAPLAVSAISRCAGTSTEFTWSPGGPFTVAAGGSTTLTVTYAPTGAGVDTGCLALASNDPNNPVSQLAVSGTGLAPSAPRIAVTPLALGFGSVTVGLSANRTTTVSNSGTATLTASVALGAGTSAEFTVAPASFTVAPGASQVVTVTYAPSAVGADTGSLVVTGNDPATPTVTVTVTGSGVAAPAPAIVLVPASVDFGPVVTGSSASRAVAIQNTGSAVLNVSSVSACSGTSAEFGWSPAAPLQVPAGGSNTLTVSYGPVDLGADTGCLTVASDDPTNPMVNLALAGSGVGQAVPAIALVPNTLDFGTVSIGGSASRTSQVRNTGTATLHVASITACSGTSAEFGWTPAGPFDVAPGGATSLGVTYTPVDAGADTGCLTVASDDPATPTSSLQLTGTGSQVTVAGDVDIDELEVPEDLTSTSDRELVPRAELRNRSATASTATAQLTATLGGATVYDQSLTVTLRARDDQSYSFPPLLVAKGTSGTIAWRLHVEDQDPDDDTATARTRVKAPEREGDDDRVSGAPPNSAGSIAARTQAPPAMATGGCSSGGPSASLGLLVALGALLLAPRRRRP